MIDRKRNILGSRHRAPKILRISCEESSEGVSRELNEVGLGKTLEDGAASGTNHVLRRLELPAPPPDLRGGERDWRSSSISNGQ